MQWHIEPARFEEIRGEIQAVNAMIKYYAEANSAPKEIYGNRQTVLNAINRWSSLSDRSKDLVDELVRLEVEYRAIVEEWRK